jgi:mevalonate kinase
MGEHAVVYGRPALAAAVDLRLTVRVSPEAGGAVHLDLPGLAHAERLSWDAVRAYAGAARESWREYSREPGPERFRAVRGNDPAHVVKTALGEASEFLAENEPSGVRLTVESGLPVGSGFGSSAATAAGVIAAYLSFRGAAAELAELQRLTLEVERRQHGLPSGIDGATVLRGGLLWARKLASGELEIEPIACRSPLLENIRVYDTGTPPESTGAVVAGVRSGRDRDPEGHERLLDHIEAATRAFRAELSRGTEESGQVRELIRECQICLEALGVVPPAVRVLVKRIEAKGGAAKISGAGSLAGPGAGSLLVYHREAERISRWPFLRPFRAYPVHLGAAGLRMEGEA